MSGYSYSKLILFENCPLAYRLKYIDRVEVEGPQSAEALTGSLVHEALQKLYNDVRFEKIPTLDELLELFRKRWSEEWTDDVVVREGLTHEHYRKMGERCLRDYYRRYYPFNQGRTIGTELRVSIKLGDYTLAGFIDRLDVTPEGVYEIHDYKTSQYLPPISELHGDRQLPLYQLGVQQSWPDAERVELVWHYLAHDQEIRVKQTGRDLERAKRWAMSVIAQIERASELDDFPPRREYCQWCEFQEVCSEWNHELRVRNLPRNQFLGEPGVKLADQLIEVKRELAKLQEREQKLKEAIIEYAKREGVTSICGARGRVLVRIIKEERFPRSGEPGREELEELLRQLGRWEEVASLDLHRLQSLVRRRQWPRAVLHKLARFQRIEESARVYIKEFEEG